MRRYRWSVTSSITISFLSALLLTIQDFAYLFLAPRSKSVTMSNPTKQHHGATSDQRAWSTTATNGSGDQNGFDVHDTNATESNRGSSSTSTPFAIERWLAEQPHEGPWNGMAVSSRPNEQAGKRD